MIFAIPLCLDQFVQGVLHVKVSMRPPIYCLYGTRTVCESLFFLSGHEGKVDCTCPSPLRSGGHMEGAV